MLIVSGRLYVQPGRRDDFLKLSLEAVVQARHASGCKDFVVAADPLDANRVNVYEEWESEGQLLAFRDADSASSMLSLIERFDVLKHAVAASGPP